VEKGDAGITSINELSKEWNEVGYVPVDQKEKTEGTFKKLVAEKLKETGKKESEVKDQLFSMKVEGMKSAQNSDELIRNEYNALTEKLQKIESGIKQYENNLGFFGSNIKDNPLVKEVLEKMEASKADAENLRAKIKMLVE
jgi:endonuclease III